MSLTPSIIEPVPEQTVLVARSAFPKGNLYLSMRDELGTLFEDTDFAELFSRRGYPAVTPGDDGVTRFYWDAVYKFKTSDGREIEDSQSDVGRVPDELYRDAEIQAEYFLKTQQSAELKDLA